MLRAYLASFELGLRGYWAIVIGTLYVIVCLEDQVCCCLICDSMLVVVVDEC